MQLGTRWPAGEQPPARLTEDWREAISAAESAGCSSGMWTLTWLEGAPRVVHDSGFEIEIGAASAEADDGW